jgi:nucleotide-binding universal stress UspA family protein
MYKLAHILIPLDGSESSRDALRLARFLSSAYEATLHWSHTVPSPAQPIWDVLLPYAAMGEDRSEFEHEILSAAKANLIGRLKIKDLEKSGRISIGNCASKTLEEARKLDPSLVVLGARSLSEGHDAKTSPNALSIVRNWDGPIISCHRLENQSPFSRVLVATDLTPGSEHLIHAGLGLAYNLNASIEVMTILPDLQRNDPAGLYSSNTRTNPEKQLSGGKKQAVTLYKHLLKTLETPFPLENDINPHLPGIDVFCGDAVEEIALNAASQPDTLLVVGRKQPGSPQDYDLGMTVETLLQYKPLHIAIIPTAKDT